MKLSSDAILTQRDDAILTLTLNRPDTLNAIDRELARTLHEALLQASQDPSVRAVVLTGAGRAFCAGGNLRAIHAEDPERMGEVFYRVAGIFHEAIVELRTMPKPVIAKLNGAAAGGGFSLAMACDLRVMSGDTFLQLAYTSNGLSIDGGGTFSLPRIVGLGRALEIALLDDRIDAITALDKGLVHGVETPDDLDDTVHHLATRLAQMPPQAIGRAKMLFNRAFDTSLEQQLDAERRALAEAAASKEGREGVQAFLEKRKPNYG